MKKKQKNHYLLTYKIENIKISIVSFLIIISGLLTSCNNQDDTEFQEPEVEEPSNIQINDPGIDSYRSSPSAAAYYIDANNGNDKSDGRSKETAWKTLDRLHRVVLVPGDVVRLARGSVWEFQNLFFDNGSAGSEQSPVIIEAYGEGEPPTISKPRALWDKNKEFAAIVFGRDWTVNTPSSYITVLDLRIEDVTSVAISMTGETHHLIIAGNEVLRCGAGVGIAGDHQKVVSNYIHDGVMAMDTGKPDQDWGANGVTVMGNDIEIAWNQFINCIAPSKSFGTDGGAVEFFGYNSTTNIQPGWAYVSNNIRIHHNVADNCDTFLEGAGKVINMQIANNLYINSKHSAILFHMNSVINDAYYQVDISNNTFICPDQNTYGSGFIIQWGTGGSLSNKDMSKLNIFNNIFVTNSKIMNWKNFIDGNLKHSHNLYYFPEDGMLSSTSGWSLDATEKIADPKFKNFIAKDYRISSISPAVGAGIISSYDYDLLQKSIKQSSTDIGAYQH